MHLVRLLHQYILTAAVAGAVLHLVWGGSLEPGRHQTPTHGGQHPFVLRSILQKEKEKNLFVMHIALNLLQHFFAVLLNNIFQGRKFEMVTLQLFMSLLSYNATCNVKCMQ